MQALEDEIGRARVEFEERGGGGGGGQPGEERTLDPRLHQKSQVENSFPSHYIRLGMNI